MSFRTNTTESYLGNGKVAERIAKYAEAMGLQAITDSSSKSASHYVEVDTPSDAGGDGSVAVAKIRIANHDLPDKYETSDLHIEPADWALAVEFIAIRAGCAVPSRVVAILRKRRAAEAEIARVRRLEDARYDRNRILRDRIDARARELGPEAFRADFTGRKGRNLRNKLRDRARQELGIEFEKAS